MATSTLTDTIKDPGGNVVATSPGTVVNFRLMANGSPTPGFRISDGVNVASLIVTSATTTGTISQALENNKNVTPGGTYYVAEILCPTSQGGTQEWALLSSSSASPQTFLQAAAGTIPSFTPITTVPASVLAGNNVFTGINQFNGDVYFKSGRPWTDVVAFGADPTGATASDVAIQAAINQVIAAGSGVVFFPPGVYKITASLTVPITARGVCLYGYGAELKGAVNDSILQISDGTTVGNRAERVSVLGLRINGNGGTDSIVFPNQNGIQIGAIIGCTLLDVDIENIPNVGVLADKSAQVGSKYLEQVCLIRCNIRFTGKATIAVNQVTPSETGDSIGLFGCLLNNGGMQVVASDDAHGGAWFNTFHLTMSNTEISAMANPNGTDGYVKALYVRKAAGTLSDIQFEANCNNKSGSHDYILDTDANGLTLNGILHGCGSTTSAESGGRITSRGNTLNGVVHAGSTAHVFVNVVDASGAKDFFATGVIDGPTSAFKPTNTYVASDMSQSTSSRTTGSWVSAPGTPAIIQTEPATVALTTKAGVTPTGLSIIGDSLKGRVQFTSGTTPTAGTLANVSFSSAMPFTPRGVTLNANSTATQAGGLCANGVSASGFAVAMVTPATTTAYDVTYEVLA